MPKVSIDNTKGLVQKSGGGVALFGAVESVSATAAGADAPIAKTTSVALVTSADDAHQADLPAIADVDTGHTIVIASIGANDLVINTPGAETVNGAATLTTGQNTCVIVVKATASTWVSTAKTA